MTEHDIHVTMSYGLKSVTAKAIREMLEEETDYEEQRIDEVTNQVMIRIERDYAYEVIAPLLQKLIDKR